MSTFEINANGSIVARVEAKNERAAYAYLRKHTTVRKLSTTEIIQTAQAGKSIVNAETGEEIGATAQEVQP